MQYIYAPEDMDDEDHQDMDEDQQDMNNNPQSQALLLPLANGYTAQELAADIEAQRQRGVARHRMSMAQHGTAWSSIDEVVDL